jgi:hypothetical protein
VFASSAAHAQTAGGEKPPIIDVHVHTFPTGQALPDWGPNPRTRQPQRLSTGKDYLQAVLATMKKHNIVKAVIGSSYPVEDVSTDEWVAASPGSFIPSRRFDSPPLPNLDSLRADCKAGRFAALGELALQYQGLELNDPMFEPYLALAEELDLPVGVHMGLGPSGAPYRGSPSFRARLGNPLLLEDLLVRHPKLRLNMMHAGNPYLQETKALLHTHPQVYVDLAVINWIIPREEFHEYLRSLVRAGFGRRLMFGSDVFPWVEAIDLAIEGIESATFLTEEQKRDIFYDNAARFLRLDTKAKN